MPRQSSAASAARIKSSLFIFLLLADGIRNRGPHGNYWCSPVPPVVFLPAFAPIGMPGGGSQKSQTKKSGKIGIAEKEGPGITVSLIYIYI
jgi:hypothetical protein